MIYGRRCRRILPGGFGRGARTADWTRKDLGVGVAYRSPEQALDEAARRPTRDRRLALGSGSVRSIAGRVAAMACEG